MSQPKQILMLQEIDTELDQAKARLAEIDVILNDNEELRIAQQNADDANQAHLDAQSVLKRTEQEVTAQEGKIENNQRVLYSGSVKNPKELEDLQLEAAAFKRHLETLEESQLEAMLAFEEADEGYKTKQVALQETKNKLATENSMLGAEQQNLTSRVEILNQERTEVCAPIDASLIDTYNALRKKRAGLAVVRFIRDDCPACGNTLTSTQAQAARSPSSITQCDTCRRILVAG